MKKIKSSLTNMVLVLTCVAVITGALLALVHSVTEGPQKAQEKLALDNGIKVVMGTDDVTVATPDTISETLNKKDYTFVIHPVSDANGASLGAAIESTTLGFGGDLKVLVGLSPDGTLLGYTLLKHAETPGLGAKADKWFQKDEKGDIIGKNLKDSLYVKKDGGNVDAITASTITSRAFLLAVMNAYQVYNKQKEEQQ